MRKNVLRSYKIVTGQNAADFDTKSNPTDVSFLDNCGITAQWTGTPVGELFVFVSNDDVDVKSGQSVTNWMSLDFGTPIVIDATNASLVINMNQLPFRWLSIGYVHGSGSGAISAQLTSKEV